jgi:hypothetical protein
MQQLSPFNRLQSHTWLPLLFNSSSKQRTLLLLPILLLVLPRGYTRKEPFANNFLGLPWTPKAENWNVSEGCGGTADIWPGSFVLFTCVCCAQLQKIMP